MRRKNTRVLLAGAGRSGLYSSFISVSRLIAPWMRLVDFMVIYAALLIGAIAVALLVVRPRMALARASAATAATPRANTVRGSV